RDVELVHAVAVVVDVIADGGVRSQLEREGEKALPLIVDREEPHLVEGVPGRLGIAILGQVRDAQVHRPIRPRRHDAASPCTADASREPLTPKYVALMASEIAATSSSSVSMPGSRLSRMASTPGRYSRRAVSQPAGRAAGVAAPGLSRSVLPRGP